jgi:hypothetical protein
VTAKADQQRAAGEGAPIISKADMDEFKAMVMTMKANRGGA